MRHLYREREMWSLWTSSIDMWEAEALCVSRWLGVVGFVVL